MTLALSKLELNLQSQGNNNVQVLPPPQRPREIGCEVLHAIPGRIRLGISKLATDRAYGEKLTYALGSLAWVGEVRINRTASCATINYQSHPALESRQQASILAIVQEADALTLLPTPELEALEAELLSFWDWLAGEVQNLLAGLERVGKETLKAIGMASLMIGIVGVILPVLPGTPFLLLSSLCFLACS